MPGEEDEGFHIGDFLGILWEHKWAILVVAVVAASLGAAQAFTSPPVYSADALLQVEKDSGGLRIFEEVSPIMESSSSARSELEIMGSRMILGAVVEKLRLDVLAQPRYFPYLGAAIARRYRGEGVSPPWFDAPEYAWGGEKIELQSLEVPDRLVNVAFLLVAGEEGGYFLVDPTDDTRLQGRVGERLERDYANGERLALFVSYLKARPGTQFTVLRSSLVKAINGLKGRLSVGERGELTGMIEASLKGSDPEVVAKVLNEILYAYVRRNVERRSAEAEKTLQFLDGQLPALKDRLEAAEEAYNSYRLEYGSVDLSHETLVVLDSVVEVDNAIAELQAEREEQLQRFTPEHPKIKALDSRINRLQRTGKKLDGDVERLPAAQQKILRLKRDVEVNNSLYTDLLNSAQELRVAKAGTVGNARIIDSAIVRTRPIGPNRNRTLMLWLFGGLALSLGLIWLRERMRVAVEHPETIERELGLPVYASIPDSKRQKKLDKMMKSAPDKAAILAFDATNDEAVESFRSLRTAVQIALMDAPNNVVLITGPSQGVGKSFVTKNYASVLVQAGHKVVMVDADLRKGHLHRQLVLEREPGLTELVRGEIALDEVIKKTDFAGLDVITAGARPPNPSELLVHQNFSNLVAELSQRYDYVIMDAPPVLAVTDPTDIARQAGTTLLVARAGRHPIGELEQTVSALKKGGITPRGFVFNAVDTTRAKYRYGYRYGYGRYMYRYEYK